MTTIRIRGRNYRTMARSSRRGSLWPSVILLAIIIVTIVTTSA